MKLRTKIALSNRLSEPTLEHLRQYLTTFCEGKYTIERFDGRVTVYTERERDAEIVASQFSRIVTRVENVY